ncbi:MAG: hypothetical protein ABSE44_05685 [Candidatus Sulfotelmatobacter sp.]|jgi:hypothetical protein
MYKVLCVAVLLLATFAFVSGSKPADAAASGLPTPVILARNKLVNQTAPIPLTVIFTPTADGLYRISVYGATTTADPNSNSSRNFQFFWTDASGAQMFDFDLIAGYNQQLGQFDEYGYSVPLVFEAKAGTPVTYAVTESGPPDNSVYAIYYTVERL